jgi:hypothetical protein
MSCIVCILLIVSWVRSYSHFNQLGRKLSDSVWFGSQAMRGQLMFSYDDDPATMAALKAAGANGWVRGEILAEDWIAPPAIQNQSLFSRLMPGFKFTRFDFRIPHWFAVLLTATIGAVAWPNWSRRFTLRTLLIVTTLVAVVLGLSVAMLR